MASDRSWKAFELCKYAEELTDAGNDEDSLRELLRRKIRKITQSKAMDFRFAVAEVEGRWYVIDRDHGDHYGPFDSEVIAESEAEYREG